MSEWPPPLSRDKVVYWFLPIFPGSAAVYSVDAGPPPTRAWLRRALRRYRKAAAHDALEAEREGGPA